jgi:predicted membrane metal-binding protein
MNAQAARELTEAAKERIKMLREQDEWVKKRNTRAQRVLKQSAYDSYFLTQIAGNAALAQDSISFQSSRYPAFVLENFKTLCDTKGFTTQWLEYPGYYAGKPEIYLRVSW